ncbi:MAG: haloalkane dehalogenase [Thermoleophilaceae bacterium]|nr:haloalkane dehalogenase [Thermoleophilaceae bacterium]
MTPPSVADLINAHLAAGRFFEADGTRSFVREQGDGEPVVLMHGVPTSSFLYRKVIGELAARGLRGVAFDLPGLGLADRPRGLDPSWTGLGRFATAAVDALGLDSFHLVVHDIGGPVGFELAAAARGRVRSLTVLNTLIEVDTFRRPWTMEMFARRGVGELWLAGSARPLWIALMRMQGVADQSAVSDDELAAHLDLLKREDGGRAFLRIMRGFERSAAKKLRYVRTLREARYPIQVAWGMSDPALPARPHARDVLRAAGGSAAFHEIAARHFPQEDQPARVAELIAAQAVAA